MEHKLSLIVCNRLLKNDVITEDMKDIYVYGFDLLFSFLISTSIIITIGLITGHALQTFLFLITFILVRRYTGGYHANTYLKCQIYTVTFYLLVTGLSLYVNIFHYIFVILELIGVLIILIWGPIDNPHKPLTKTEKKKHKITGLILFSLVWIAGITIKLYNNILGNTLFYTLALIIILMIVPLFERRIKNEEVTED